MKAYNENRQTSLIENGSPSSTSTDRSFIVDYPVERMGDLINEPLLFEDLQTNEDDLFSDDDDTHKKPSPYANINELPTAKEAFDFMNNHPIIETFVICNELVNT